MPAAERPKLREDVTWKCFPIDGEITYTLRDELSQEHCKLDEVSGAIAVEMDGTKSIDDLVAFARKRFPGVTFDRDYVVDLADDLKRFKLMDDPFALNALMTARIKKERSELTVAKLKNLLLIDIGAVNPEKFLSRTYPFIAFAFQTWFVWLGFLLFGLSCLLLWTNLPRAAESAALAFSDGLLGVFLMVVAITLVLIIHELGHGYAVKHYGGRVPRIGFLLMYGLPGMFCDTSDAGLFPERSHRIVVSIAGAFTELFSATLATAVWMLTPTDLLVNHLAYNVMMFSSVTGLILNFNPLVKLDGYFVLMDYLDMPDLQEKSYGYLGYLFRRHVLRMRVDCPVEGRRRKRIFLIYGGLSLLYSVMFGILVYVFFRGFLVDHLALLGVVLSLVLLYAYLKRPVGPIFRTARLFALDHRGAIRRSQPVILAIAILFIAGFFLLPVRGRQKLIAQVEPARQEALVAPEDLRIAEARFFAGQSVKRGETIAVLDADSLRTGAAAGVARMGQWRVRAEEARRQGQEVDAVTAQGQARMEGELSGWSARRVQRTILRAPFDGRVLSESWKGYEGAAVDAGDTVCMVGDFSAVRASAVVPDFDLDDLEVGAPVNLRLRAAPDRLLRGAIEAIEPVPLPPDAPRLSRVWIRLDDRPVQARQGMSLIGWARTPSRPPAAHLSHWIARFLRMDLWV